MLKQWHYIQAFPIVLFMLSGEKVYMLWWSLNIDRYVSTSSAMTKVIYIFEDCSMHTHISVLWHSIVSDLETVLFILSLSVHGSLLFVILFFRNIKSRIKIYSIFIVAVLFHFLVFTDILDLLPDTDSILALSR